jgi:hypothetical protein
MICKTDKQFYSQIKPIFYGYEIIIHVQLNFIYSLATYGKVSIVRE